MVGRPRKIEPEIVLQKAMEAFWAKGYEATSMADLMEATGLHKGSLYQTFGDKHQLFVTALESYLNEMWQTEQQIMRDAKSPLAAIRDVMRAMIDIATSEDAISRGCLAVNTLVEKAPHDSKIFGLMEAHFLKSLQAMVGQVEAAQAVGEVNANRDPEQTALMLMTFVMGLSVGLKGPIDADNAYRLAEAQLDMLIT